MYQQMLAEQALLLEAHSRGQSRGQVTAPGYGR